MRGKGKCSGHLGLGRLDAVAAAARSAEVRRAKAQRRQRTALEWAAVKLEEHGEELAELVIKAARAGDWRAVAFLFDRVYGKPQEHVELSGGGALDFSLMSRAERDELIRRAAADPAVVELLPESYRARVLELEPGPGTPGWPSGVVGADGSVDRRELSAGRV